MRDTDNQTNESDTTRRERAGSLAEQRRTAAKLRGETVLDSAADIAHDRHDVAIFEEARQELDLDNPEPLDASGDFAERTFGRTPAGAEAEAGAEAGAGADAAEADADAAEAEARHGRAAERDGVDGEKLTPILAALALLRKKSERSRGPAPRLRPAPNVGRKPPPGRGLVGGGKIKESRAPAAPRNTGRGGPAPRL